MKLFIIPFAGGMSSTYLTWKEKITTCSVRPIILRGRESRVSEGLYDSFEDAVEDIANEILDILDEDDDEFALFGHSMGALLAYEVYFKLVEECAYPEAVFFSGRRPPNIGNDTKPLYKYPLEELKNELVSKGGMDASFFDNEELMDLFVPVIRSDYKILYEYEFEERDKKLECKVVVLNGTQDSVPVKEMEKWGELSAEKIKMYNISGNHFFTMSNPDEVCSIIEKELSQYYVG